MSLVDTPSNALDRLERLVQSGTGLVDRVTTIPTHPGEPRFPVMVAALGDIAATLGDHHVTGPARSVTGVSDGAGSGLAETECRLRAIGEAVERYASCIYDERQFIRATANELGDAAMRLADIPRCSATELAHPRCPIGLPPADRPIRWVRGLNLMTGADTWIPAVMVYLHFASSPDERFWLPISTGCAAHSSVERALLGGVCEVVERDAIALTWLQQLPLPRIELDQIPGDLEPFLARNQGHAGVDHLFFDATTDLGIPTVYSLQRTPHNPALTTLVMCSTELTAADAIAKVIRESAASRLAMQQPQTIPASFDDFCAVSHGAALLGRAEHTDKFAFLLDSSARRPLSTMSSIASASPRAALSEVLRRLSLREFEAFAVDLTTDEARRAGVWVVRVLVPGLQPLSFSYRARYLGHPRLFDAPRRMGHRVLAEPHLNPWPQPFA